MCEGVHQNLEFYLYCTLTNIAKILTKKNKIKLKKNGTTCSKHQQ